MRIRGMRAMHTCVFAATVFLAACSTEGPYRVPVSGAYPPPEFAHRVASPQVEVYWNCGEATPGVVQLDGVVHNFGGRDVRFASVEAVGVNAMGQSVSDSVVALPDIVLGVNQSSPFHITLRATGSEVRYDLYYWYWTHGHGFGLLGTSSVERQWYARNVCVPSQHVARS